MEITVEGVLHESKVIGFFFLRKYLKSWHLKVVHFLQVFFLHGCLFVFIIIIINPPNHGALWLTVVMGVAMLLINEL